MVFNYGETLRIRRDLYTILGKIRYIDTHGKIGYEYKLVRHKNNAEFWLSWDKKRDAYQFSQLCGKALPADMKLVDSGYEMVTGTWGEVDVGTTDTAKYKEYENVDGTATFSVQEWAFETEYSKGFYINKEYVSVEKDSEVTESILDKMDTIKKLKFIGPIGWILGNLLLYMPIFDIKILNDVRDVLIWPYIVAGSIVLGIIVLSVLIIRRIIR
ncbi:hypothetical protein [Veillonella parvula]|uniref:hypothetical protein n=1 Tax=Veillonella parvula TaxID=29466 RepID=UPI00242B3E12|nr:hypothetical protein [Veillonella parvula]